MQLPLFAAWSVYIHTITVGEHCLLYNIKISDYIAVVKIFGHFQLFLACTKCAQICTCLLLHCVLCARNKWPSYVTTCYLTFWCLMQPSCNSFPSHGQSLPRIQPGLVHHYSMTHARILGNGCPQFEKLLQDCVKSLYTLLQYRVWANLETRTHTVTHTRRLTKAL